MMRGSTGLKLAMPSQIHFLRPEQLSGPYGAPLTGREQRLLFGLYVWKATFEGLPWPPLPTDDEFLTEVARVQSIVGRGLPLGNPLDALYVAPNDYCDERGEPWGKTRQRKMFRDALRDARAYAESIAPLLKEVYGVPDCQIPDPQMFKSTAPVPRAWKPGQRRPMCGPPPQFPGLVRPIVKRRFGRPDLPPYVQENLMPARPYAVAPSNDNIRPWYVAVNPVTDDVVED